MMGVCGWGGFGLIGMILNVVITIGLIAGVVLLILWLVRRFSAIGHQPTLAQNQSTVELSPKEVLQIRYARGEITRDQYRQMLGDLS